MCAFALAGALAAQDAAQTPTFRSGIDAVTVDAIVTDKQGHPVTDLTAADFEIVENKKPQAIQTFKLVKIDDTTQPESSFVHDITSIDEMQRETARDDMRVIVIFLDDYHVRAGNSLVVKQQLAKFVSGLTSHDLVAVMYPLMSVKDLTFSRNHETNADIVAHVSRRNTTTRRRTPTSSSIPSIRPRRSSICDSRLSSRRSAGWRPTSARCATARSRSSL
jgi:hypothetical protein